MTNDQCICHQNGTFIGEKPSNGSKISHLNKTSIADTADLGRKGKKSGFKHDTDVPKCKAIGLGILIKIFVLSFFFKAKIVFMHCNH